jgi:hypothetical protein
MKPLNVFLLLILILTMALSCNSTRKISLAENMSEISFGRTGGFTNIPDEYRINEKGDVFKITGNELTKVNSLSRRRMKRIAGQFNGLDFDHCEINEPGNISYFIRVVTPDYEKRVIWNDLTSNDPLKDLYNELLKTLKQ